MSENEKPDGVIEKAEKEISQILEKYNLKYGYTLDFPRYRELPDEVNLGLSVLNTHGLKVVVTLVPTGEVKK